ncbi:YeeE/YedE family protein [Oceanicoccus sp. KOV_DT_Chl]|uniref:YeeE/YedE family protein n=1 Tax=Oceanicoccus sp. KOV_DT_Chl TaxID=1904639 RepID=UPI000C7D3652|nr:YeeE/YedE thiosulfate transporter family protein [Oceanicoccus sp. KOV_DT_Chl]
MYLNWKIGGLLLGLIFLLTVAIVKPIGVSTQFVILDGIVASWFYPQLVQEDSNSKTGYSSSNPYLDKSGGKYAQAAAKPQNYGMLFVIAMALGGTLSHLTLKKSNPPRQQIPHFHQARFGSNSKVSRYSLAFIGGVLALWGARLAGGCTSGHMMSGMMQTSISAYLFTLAAFAVAIPVSIALYRRR